MQNETLRCFTAAVSVDVLRFLDRRECDQRERLCFATLKNRGAMRAWKHADFATDLPQILITAAVHAFLFFENAFAKRFLLHVIERLRDRERIRLRMLLQDRHLHFFAQRCDGLAARDFAGGVKCAFDFITCYLIGDLQQLRLHI